MWPVTITGTSGSLRQQLLLLLGGDVRQQDHEVRLSARLFGVAAHGGGDRHHAPGAAGVSGVVRVPKLFGFGADHGHAQAAHLLHHVRLLRQQRAALVGHVGGDHGVARRLHELAQALPAVIEIVVADGGDVEAEQVGDFVDGQAAVDGGDGGALHQVAGVEQQAGAAAQALLADDGGQLRRSRRGRFRAASGARAGRWCGGW